MSSTNTTSIPTDRSNLEAIALAFCEKIEEQGLVKDRKYNLRTYEKVLVGQEAVSVMVEVLQERGYDKVSRQEATLLGQEMNDEFQLLGHAVHEDRHPLKDEYLFYRFKKNLPIQVQRAKEGKSFWDILDLIEDNIDIQDRVYHFRTYPQCFLGQEAVDLAWKLKLAIDREDAVSLLQQANQEVQAFEHVTRDHLLQDKYLFYRFIPKKYRPINPENQGQTYAALLEAMTTALDNSIHGSILSSAVSTISEDEEEDGASAGYLRQRPESFSTQPAESDSVASSLDYSTVVSLLPPNTSLQDIADALERDLTIKDHRYRFTVYKNCFVARDAVTHMVKKGLAPNRRRAEMIGRFLQSHLNLWRHVTDGHQFRDKYYFFRFTPKTERRQAPNMLASSSFASDGASPQTDANVPAIPSRGNLGSRIPSNRASIEEALQNAHTTLEEIAVAFEKGVKVKDRVYHMKTYKNVFTGASGVSFFVKRGFCSTRQDAVLLGRLLNEECSLFQHVGSVEKDLWDCPWTVYQFLPTEERKARQDLKHRKEETWTAEGLKGSDEKQVSATDGAVAVDQELLEVADLFRRGVKIKHNRYRGKIYQNTFVGSQAVDFLVNSTLANDRREAVKLGRRLMTELKLFDHVTRNHPFSDDYLFFRLEEHRTHSKITTSGFVGQAQDSINTLPIISEGDQGFGRTSAITSVQTDDLFATTEFLPLEEIAREFRKNMEIKDRRYLFSTYKDTFVGSEAVDYLVGKTSWASSRREAVQVGNTLMRELDLFKHVTDSHPFEDEYYFYKFTDDDEDTMLERLQLELSETDMPFLGTQPAKLADAARSMEEGLKPKSHNYRFRVYNNVCVGSEIVSFLVDAGLATSRGEAVHLGRAVNKQFNLFEHVTLDHLLKDSNLYYRFVPRENRWKGKWLENSFGGALRNKMMKALRQRTGLSIKEYWDIISEAIEQDIWDIRASVREQKVKNFRIESDDYEWTNRVRSFEIEFSVRAGARRDSRMSVELGPRSGDIYSRVRCWSQAFIRLDPRQQIHRFYNEVAQTGLTLVEESGGDSTTTVRAVTLDDLRPLFRFLPINLASVFSVWRPTSYDAIRKMMTGDAVGKGLDIKGKSAKRGKLSGYVPFLQISENNHKRKVRRLSPNHNIRIFYKSNCRRARDIAIVELEKVLMEMIEMVKEAKQILSSDRVDKEIHESALEVMLLDIDNPSITSIDEYAPDSYGIEMPERLFWEAYFVNQDCTRKEGSVYDSGRPSQSAYQDMNFAALRSKPHKGAPRPVVFQNADRDDPMNPFEILMAYEEHGRVRPVVSDFDCFLVGTRRVDYNIPLPKDQVEVLKWCVHHIERIVEAQLEEYRVNKNKEYKPWSLLWLEVLKESSFHPEIPRFGFGDPVSYSIVQNAVERLQMSGAVRHGAECFNYYFPQDLDDEFLVVCHGIGEGNVPWKYVNVDQLLDFLVEKIEDGFCFPLNPKWVLMDYGWMNLYRKLLGSPREHVQRAMDIWFPPETGLREDIDRIYKLQKENLRLRNGTQSSYMNLLESTKEEMMYFM